MPLEYIPKISSTNDFIRENLSIYSHNFCGIYSFCQTKGRGMKNNSWISEPEKNIAMTFCLTDLSILTNLSFWVAVITCEYIEKIMHIPVFIKWPNDILINNKKIAGILIEKSNNIFIIGIGINVLQRNFDLMPRASSLLCFSEKEYNLSILTEELLQNFQTNYFLLEKSDVLIQKYNQYLFGKNKIMTFKINDQLKNGVIQKVESDGLLQIKFEDNLIQKFRIKDIELLY